MSGIHIPRRRVLQAVAAGATLSGVAQSATAKGDVNGHIVKFEPGRSTRPAKRRASSVYRELDFEHLGKAVAGRFSSQALEALARNPNVRYIEEDRAEFRAIAQTVPWGVDRVDADVVRAAGVTGSGAHIAIIDTGIDDNHEDLQANLGTGVAFTDCSGTACTYAWSDDNNHGTHCAGIAAAVDNDRGVVGCSSGATLHAVKVLDSTGNGYLSDVAAGIQYVADQGWDVGSMSLGAASGSATLRDACQYATDKGVLLVAAAGNDGPCSDCVGYPAAYDTVIAVSSTDSDDSLSSFSSTGPEVDLAAPGGGIYSTVMGSDYATFSGTSMACPHVSGVAGQLMSNGFSSTEARDRLQATAEDIGLGANEQGYGLLDAEAAVLTGFLVTSEAASSVTETSATLVGALNDLDGAASADLSFEWREVGAASWNTTSPLTRSQTGAFSEDLSGLSTGTAYEFRAVGEASDGDTDTGATLTFTPSHCVDATRWPAGTGAPGDEHITDLNLDGQVGAASGDNAYYDFTCPDVVTVQPGGSFDLAMGFEDAGYDNHYANVYVDWAQSGDWSTATQSQFMEGANDATATYTTTVSVPSDAAPGATLARVRLSWNQFYGPSATGEYGEVQDFTIYVEESGERPPSIDGLSMVEVETSDPDAVFDVDWQVSDVDGNLSSVSLTLSDDVDGATEDGTKLSVDGDTATGTTRLVAAGDDGTANSYTVELTAVDGAGNTASQTVRSTESEPGPAVDALSVAEVETSDGDAAFDASWSVSDPDADLSTVELSLAEESASSAEDSVILDVSGGSASDTTRLVAAGDDGSGNAYTVSLRVSDGSGNAATELATITESEPNSPPVVQSLSGAEVESSDGDAAFDIDWSVSDPDGNLGSVALTLTDDADGTTEETVSVPVSGQADSGTTRLTAAGDDGTGHSYTVDLTVTDGEQATASATTGVTDTEAPSNDTPPTIDAYSVSEAGSPNPHAEITATWTVSDVDSDLSQVAVVVVDASGTTVDSSTSAVSGPSASGTAAFSIKHANGSTFDVTVSVVDSNGNEVSKTESVTE